MIYIPYCHHCDRYYLMTRKCRVDKKTKQAMVDVESCFLFATASSAYRSTIKRPSLKRSLTSLNFCPAFLPFSIRPKRSSPKVLQPWGVQQGRRKLDVHTRNYSRGSRKGIRCIPQQSKRLRLEQSKSSNALPSWYHRISVSRLFVKNIATFPVCLKICEISISIVVQGEAYYKSLGYKNSMVGERNPLHF
mmetsp:Transcript_6661/g.19203  ORF Transcript_6661/g.19203 Transcript_6661/m.19203 type:complete len:191 (-) Transcript_6661:2362-2934(-)